MDGGDDVGDVGDVVGKTNVDDDMGADIDDVYDWRC